MQTQFNLVEALKCSAYNILCCFALQIQQLQPNTFLVQHQLHFKLSCVIQNVASPWRQPVSKMKQYLIPLHMISVYLLIPLTGLWSTTTTITIIFKPTDLCPSWQPQHFIYRHLSEHSKRKMSICEGSIKWRGVSELFQSHIINVCFQCLFLNPPMWHDDGSIASSAALSVLFCFFFPFCCVDSVPACWLRPNSRQPSQPIPGSGTSRWEDFIRYAR